MKVRFGCGKGARRHWAPAWPVPLARFAAVGVTGVTGNSSNRKGGCNLLQDAKNGCAIPPAALWLGNTFPVTEAQKVALGNTRNAHTPRNRRNISNGGNTCNGGHHITAFPSTPSSVWALGSRYTPSETR